MSIIDKNVVDELISRYSSFIESAKYRRYEDFYSPESDIMELSYNENPLGAGELAKEAIRYHAEFSHLYPPICYFALTEKLASKLNVNQDNIIVSSGSVAAIQLAVYQYAERNDEIIYSKSSMPWYKWSVLGNCSIPVEVPLLPDMNHDLEGILDAVSSKTRLIIISNPHNPTGLYINENILLEFINRVPNNVKVVIDQAYYEYTDLQEKILIDEINKRPNLILTRTFSKIHGLAGLRVGYAISTPEIIKGMKAKWLGSMPTIPSVSSFAAMHALDDVEHLAKSRKFNEEVKTEIYALAQLYNIPILKSEANFVLIKVGDSVKAEKIFQENGFRLTAGYFFGYPKWIRFSFNDINKGFITNLRKTINELF
jgi:histidinol-phosphate aminotransferase